MGIILWIILGIVAGYLAKFIMPGKDGGGVIITCILGIVGSFVGVFLAQLFHIGGASLTSFSFAGVITAVVGACVVLFIYRLLKK